MNFVEKNIKDMFPDWEQVKCEEWSKFTKYITGWRYLNQIKSFKYEELDKTLYNACLDEIKILLFKEGHEAIVDFLGHEYPEDKDKKVTGKRIKEKKMPLAELLEFCKKYNFDEELMQLNFEIGLYHEPDDDRSEEEYQDTYTVQVFCGDDVIFCEMVFKNI